MIFHILIAFIWSSIMTYVEMTAFKVRFEFK